MKLFSQFIRVDHTSIYYEFDKNYYLDCSLDGHVSFEFVKTPCVIVGAPRGAWYDMITMP
jgi:hypothetical protein